MKNIIEKIKRIEEIEKETERLNSQVRELQNKKLTAIIEATKDKYEYSPIYNKETFGHYENTEYFKDENDEYLKGVCIIKQEIKFEMNKDKTFTKELVELFFMEDGTLKVFKEIIQLNDHCIEKTFSRELIENYDICDFCIECIIDSINELLDDKIVEISNQLDSEKDKWNCLESIKIMAN